MIGTVKVEHPQKMATERESLKESTLLQPTPAQTHTSIGMYYMHVEKPEVIRLLAGDCALLVAASISRG